MKNFILTLILLMTSNLWAKTLVCLGDSLTEGYGIEANKAYPQLIEKKLREKHGSDWKVINSGISGSTSASAPSRMKWILKSNPDYVLLALGANDGLRGVPVSSTEENLIKAIKVAQEKNVKTILAGMKLPPNYGANYIKDFEKMFTRVSTTMKIPLMPFLLEDVAGKAELNLPDGIHPNEKGHEILAKNVYDFLVKNILKTKEK